ncbi:hypothetical protein [Paraburkholderia sp. BCC1886]|uniref:hypothetical protein n=1 Tax=Paraburkholderia sp. BCC1886 TaxID=2562670 RepID=UPI00118340EF|nr:hypothetical protein [Paraburkholderia sp. BCC1886]
MSRSLLGFALSSIALEEVINGRQASTHFTDDSVLAGSGGACVFVFSQMCKLRCGVFLREHKDGIQQARESNNPGLVKEIGQVIKTPADTYLMLFSNELRSRLDAAEFEAVYQHECGHIYHRHLEQRQQGTYDEFISRELEADAHAVKTVDPGVMMSGLEKALTFGTEQQVLWSQGTSNSFIRKLFDSDIIDALTFKTVYAMNKAAHIRRFKTLEALKKQKNKE